jgi:hypothetical protein
MRKSLPLRRPTPAFAVAFVALLVALGGTAYAGLTIPKNSVGTKQLKKAAVTTPKIKNGAVTASKINTSGLTVPNAKQANSASTASFATTASSASTATSATNATNATNASTVGGETVTKVFNNLAPDTSDVQIYSGGGLTLFASCSMTTGNLELLGSSSQSDSPLSWSGSDAGTFDHADVQLGTVGQSEVLGFADNYGSINISYSNPSGQTATLTLGMVSQGAFGQTDHCAVWGTGVASG